MSIDSKILKKSQKLFGNNLKKIRDSRGYTQLDLATLCDVEHTTISRIENGRTNITLKTALILSIALEIKIQDLFQFDFISES